MTETLSIRIDAETKKRLDALAKHSKRSKSFRAAEAISAYVESEEWQLGELQAGIAELNSGEGISDDKVSKWLGSWGNTGKTGTSSRIPSRTQHSSLSESVELLQRQPNMGRPGRLPGTRELVVPDTPYVIPYRVRHDQLELIAVFHGRQRWPQKL